jgi:CheY-like chemotaxis protein/tRNA A-37 threonylcarbamoyl transferase component Bud32
MADTRIEPPKISRGEFAQNLADSGLFEVAELPPAGSDSGVSDGAEAAREWVVAGKLTPFQADAVLGRRFDDLRMGNYEILDRLGAGGMGTVYKARHRRMKRIVALKVLSKEVAASEKFTQRFQREVETIARLTHPNIVMAFDADEGAAGPFLVMEFVNGRDLASEVTTGGPMPVEAAVDRILQAARGLEYAHAQGIIHRDIKPGNILRDATGVVKVADLGLARFRDPGTGTGGTSLTQAGFVCGTADYMSPEQAIDSGGVDQRADVYSLGCTLYFLLVGHPPYAGGSVMAVMLKHRDAPVPSLCAARRDVPSEIEVTFRRMVAKRAEDRYPSMTEVVRDLEHARATVKLTSGPPSSVVPPPGATDWQQPTAELEAVPPAGAPGAVPAGRFAGLTVVVAEPSRTQAGIIRNYLQQLGVAAHYTAGSGREALETVKRVAANVLISSLHLSDMTGAQLGAALRHELGANVGFVLATSESQSEMTAELPRDSRTVMMLKPFDLDRLARALASAIG